MFRLTKLFGGNWRIEVGNVVGVVGLPDLTIIIEPKIGTSHFAYLLARSNGMTRTDSSLTSLQIAPALQGLVIEWFVRELDDLFRRGLLRDYVRSADRLPYVRGRVNLASTSRHWLQGRVVTDSEFEDFTEDTPVHRFLAAAVLQATRSRWASDWARARLSYASRELPAHSIEPPPDDYLEGLSPQYRHYERALNYAKDILSGVGRSLNSGDQDSGTFLLNSAAAVEEGIRAVLSDGLYPMRVVKTGGRKLVPALVSVNPDLEIGPPPFTGDVKYKIGDRHWNRQDLAQAVLFAVAYNSPHAIIADFVERDHSVHSLHVGDVQVSRLRWIIGEGTTPEDSERRFVEDARVRVSKAMSAL